VESALRSRIKNNCGSPHHYRHLRESGDPGVVPAKAGIQVLKGIARKARDLKIYLWVADPRQVTFSCLSKKKSPKRKTPRMAQHPPALRASGTAMARRHFPVPAGHARDPARAPTGARPEACDARVRHTGFEKPSKKRSAPCWIKATILKQYLAVSKPRLYDSF
jgi:hypothetical protein